MKSYVFLGLCTFPMLLSCSQDFKEEQQTSNVMEANDRIPLKYELARMNGRIYRIPVLPESIQILLDKHIVLVDGEYRISIPKSEVIGIGITGKEYEQICSEIGAANKLLKETIDEVLATPRHSSFGICYRRWCRFHRWSTDFLFSRERSSRPRSSQTFESFEVEFGQARYQT